MDKILVYRLKKAINAQTAAAQRHRRQMAALHGNAVITEHFIDIAVADIGVVRVDIPFQLHGFQGGKGALLPLLTFFLAVPYLRVHLILAHIVKGPVKADAEIDQIVNTENIIEKIAAGGAALHADADFLDHILFAVDRKGHAVRHAIGGGLGAHPAVIFVVLLNIGDLFLGNVDGDIHLAVRIEQFAVKRFLVHRAGNAGIIHKQAVLLQTRRGNPHEIEKRQQNSPRQQTGYDLFHPYTPSFTAV